MAIITKDLSSTESYFFPFEGEKHLATIIEIPYREDTWRNKAENALAEFENLVKTIAKFERVVCVIDPRIDYKTVSRFQVKNVTILREKYDDSWARDNLPVFLKNDDKLVGVDFKFNAWGGDFNGLYKDYKDDDALGRKVLLDLRIERKDRKDFILEGGSIHTDGRKTLITTEECLLSKGRNSNLTKEEITSVLKETLQVENVVFIPYGVYNDETSGHVDNIVAFLDKETIAIGVSKDKDDVQYERSLKDLEVLKNMKDVDGNSYKIVEIPLPAPIYLTKEEEAGLVKNDEAVERLEGRRLAASYINFYQSDKFVIVPQFGVKEDKEALDIFNDFYKGKKEVIPLHSKEILLGGGNIHCVTKEIPFSSKYHIEPED